ncbi:hypothetical protein FRB93_003681 [Tulasnella sp. JGI-2019a]|nr:hypothetical protein FRB93_003681 [Tulasnella sp. JGI-2019a]
MMYNTPPEDVQFDLMESVLRVASKYEAEQYQAWAMACLKKYPTTNDTVESVYNHPKWKTYFRDPIYCIRLIRLAELLNLRDLDALELLSYYALSVIDWDVYDKGEAFQGLDAHIIRRLTRGERKRFAINVQAYLTVFLSEGGKHPGCKTADSQGRCSAAVELTRNVILPSINGDLIGALIAAPPSPCRIIADTIATVIASQYTLIKLFRI